MNITKEKMLERIREWKGAFDTHPDKMDEWSLCFMEDYKVYDAIRSLIEKSGKIITLNLKTGETKTTWEPAAKTLIESSGDKDKLRGSSNVGIERKPDGPGSSPGPRSSPLPDEVDVEYWRKITSEADKRNTAPVQKGTHLSTSVEVEEAMRWFNDVLSLLESINIRIDETDAPHVAVIRAALTKPKIRVTSEWVKKLAYLWDDDGYIMDDDWERAIKMLKEIGIEVEGDKP